MTLNAKVVVALAMIATVINWRDFETYDDIAPMLTRMERFFTHEAVIALLAVGLWMLTMPRKKAE